MCIWIYLAFCAGCVTVIARFLPFSASVWNDALFYCFFLFTFYRHYLQIFSFVAFLLSKQLLWNERNLIDMDSCTWKLVFVQKFNKCRHSSVFIACYGILAILLFDYSFNLNEFFNIILTDYSQRKLSESIWI